MITFVIPTINRPHLKNALRSLKNQTNGDWLCIVAGDGRSPRRYVRDDRVSYMRVPKLQSAGEVRNYVVENSVTTPWVGFLDDDDELNINYVSEFYKLVEKVDPDAILFKMNNYGTIVPTDRGDNWISRNSVRYGNIGMSFCMKTELARSVKFDNERLTGSGEDHRMVLNTLNTGAKIWVSEYVGYHVRRIPL